MAEKIDRFYLYRVLRLTLLAPELVEAINGPSARGGGRFAGADEGVSGMQRLNAIFSFIEHGFLLADEAFDINEFARAKQAADAGDFTEYPADVIRMPPKKCADLLDYQLAVTIFPGERDERITTFSDGSTRAAGS